MAASVVDRLVAWASPKRGLERARYREALQATAYYEAGGKTRRTNDFRRNTTDANASFRGQLSDIRGLSHNLVRNNSYAARGIQAVTNNTVGHGIKPKIEGRNKTESARLKEIWDRHAETSQCDADGKHDIYGLQRLVMRTVAESGECLVRRRARLLRDGFALPFRVQVLEPDYIDDTKDGPSDIAGNVIVQGVEFNVVGKRVAYWLFDQHPGNGLTGIPTSKRVSADNIAHVFRTDRAGQVRGVPWLAPVALRLAFLYDYEDAQLEKQRVAACFGAFVTNSDVPGDDPAVEGASTNDSGDVALQQNLRPGLIQHVPPGKEIVFPDPPTVGEYAVVTEQTLRAIAAGLGITYECLTGNLSQVNFSSGRMGWLEMHRNLADWQDHTLIPGFCVAFENWFTDAALFTYGVGMDAKWTWSAPSREMIDPANEVPPIIKAIRAGLKSLKAVHRENGYDSETILGEIAESNELLDKLKLILDSDPRRVTQVGQELSPNQGGQDYARRE